MSNQSLADSDFVTQSTTTARQLLINMIKHQFYPIFDYHLAIINQANEQQLINWTVKLSATKDLEEVLGKAPNPRAENLIKLLQAKFTQVPETYLQRINTADEQTLEKWRIRYFAGKSLRQIFGIKILENTFGTSNLFEILWIVIKMLPPVALALIILWRIMPGSPDPIDPIVLVFDLVIAVLFTIGTTMVTVIIAGIFGILDK